MSAPENPGDSDRDEQGPPENTGNPYPDDEQRGPPEHTYESREEAREKAREKFGGEDWNVKMKRVDGEQRAVIECRCEKRNTSVGTLEVRRDDL